MLTIHLFRRAGQVIAKGFIRSGGHKFPVFAFAPFSNNTEARAYIKKVLEPKYGVCAVFEV